MRVLNGTELRLYGPVGYMDSGEGFTALDVVDALAAVGADTAITIRINSGGGWAHDGVAIHTALAAHRGKVTVQVDAVALSAASLIAMAGDDVVMATGALMMIHDPSVITVGTAEDHGRSVGQLQATAAAMADIYAWRTRKSVAAIRAAMAAETWMTAAEAVAAGYADRAGFGSAKAAASFDHSVYSHVPFTALAAMAAQARAESPEGRASTAGWAKSAARLNGPAAVEVDPATDRVDVIRAAADERGVSALGQQLALGNLPAADALALIYRHPIAAVRTSAIDGVPTLATMLANRRSAS